MKQVRFGAVSYLNAQPLVCGLERHSRFSVRFDIPSKCATLLHEGAVDVGLIPSIEYLRGDPSTPYSIVPKLAIASRGPVASVALYTTKPVSDVRSIAMDVSSRASVALLHVLCARAFRIQPVIENCGPDLVGMLAHCDAALIIGDLALLRAEPPGIEKIDLGDAWTTMTGLPFVYAFWAGRSDALEWEDVEALVEVRDVNVGRLAGIAQHFFADRRQQSLGANYLRDNIRYDFGDEERAGLETFYRYAAEVGLVQQTDELRFYR